MFTQQLKTFFNIHCGWLHWWSIKIYSLIIIVPLFLLNIELLLGLSLFFILHTCLGFEIIFKDYVHCETFKELLITLLRLISILIIRQYLVIFIL